MGRTHGVLSEDGKMQAEKTGQRLQGENIDFIYSSPLNRCLDTANLINKNLGIEIKTHELLVERDFGNFTNANAKDINFDDLDLDTEENKSAGVESMDSVKARVQNFLKEIFLNHQNQNILVVTHNNPIRFFLAEFLNKTYFEILKEYKVRNCSINIFETVDGKNYKQILLDYTLHLK
jgi:probable phosphoglycerate mutase